MNDRARELLLDLARNKVLVVEAAYNGAPATIRYRPAMVMRARTRFPGGIGGEAPMLNTLTAFADIFESLVVDGRSLAVGRTSMTLSTFEIVTHMIPHVVEHAERWLDEQAASGSELLRQAERRATRRGG